MAWLAFAMMSRPSRKAPPPSSWSAPAEGGGTNVVNVMLVDFRGFDTFGEIVVLGIVALTVYALLRRFRPAREAMDMPEQQRLLPGDVQTDLLNPRNASDTAVGYLMVPAVLVRLLLPFATLVAAYIFVRGHNQPGGGFVAGLVFSVALLLQYIISGTQWVEAHCRCIRAAGLPRACCLRWARAWVGGRGLPLPDQPHLPLHAAAGGRVHLASATFFDIGVFALVVGSTMLILTAIAHQSVRGHRFHARLLEEQEQGQETEANRAAQEGAADGNRSGHCHRRAHRLGRVAAAAPAYLPGHHGPGAAVLCRQPVHLQHGAQGLAINKEPVLQNGCRGPAHYADPMPQALVLTAIVIGFAMTALFLVVLLASRGIPAPTMWMAPLADEQEMP
jgi:multicomponent K+:H+ antiporter subunit A